MLISLKKYGLVFLDQIVVSAGNFLTSIILARALGIEVFGYFSAIWLLVLISNTIVMSVSIFPMMSNYHLLKDNEKNNFIIGNIGVFFLILCFSVFVLSVIFSFNDLSGDSANIHIFIFFLFALISINAQELVRRIFITKDNIKLALFSDSVTTFMRISALGILSGTGDLTFQSTFAVCGISAFIGAILPWHYLPKVNNLIANSRLTWSINFASAKWLLPSGLMQWTSINLYISMAVFLISPAAVGIIKVCQSLLAVLNILIQGAENIIPLEASKLYKNKDIKQMWNYLIKVSAVGSIPFVLLSILCFFFGGRLLSFFYGDIYTIQGEQVLYVYSIAYVFVFLVVPIRAGLRTVGKTDIWFKAYIMSSIVSICSVYWLEVNYSSLGAVLGILIAHIILVLILMVFLP